MEQYILKSQVVIVQKYQRLQNTKHVLTDSTGRKQTTDQRLRWFITW